MLTAYIGSVMELQRYEALITLLENIHHCGLPAGGRTVIGKSNRNAGLIRAGSQLTSDGTLEP